MKNTVPAEVRLTRLLTDPTFPDWGKRVIEDALSRDAVDVTHVLNTLACLFDQRCDQILGEVTSLKEQGIRFNVVIPPPAEDYTNIPDGLEYWTADEIAECLDGISRATRAVLWSFTEKARKVGQGKPRGGDGSPEHTTSYLDQPKAFWPALTDEQRQEIAEASGRCRWWARSEDEDDEDEPWATDPRQGGGSY